MRSIPSKCVRSGRRRSKFHRLRSGHAGLLHSDRKTPALVAFDLGTGSWKPTQESPGASARTEPWIRDDNQHQAGARGNASLAVGPRPPRLAGAAGWYGRLGGGQLVGGRDRAATAGEPRSAGLGTEGIADRSRRPATRCCYPLLNRGADFAKTWCNSLSACMKEYFPNSSFCVICTIGKTGTIGLVRAS
jgi:hypothetical protein